MMPFSAQAKEWEPIALELREIAGARPSDIIDPWALAHHLGLRVLHDLSIITALPNGHSPHLLGDGREMWSGGIHPTPLPDGTLICLLNPLQSALRHKSTLMEEVSHVYLDHETTKVQSFGDGLRFRDYDKKQETQAFGVGAAALLPWDRFFKSVNMGMSAERIAATFQVTVQLVEYRIKITGATNVYRARQRSDKKLQ
ncbi:MAG: ImmA/IrrE family metallo-endopeptidase [Nitrospira sp. NTP2]|nr:ImmA/IrrE family metallo-endopeptidase [Nitrospira sp. NTP2]